MFAFAQCEQGFNEHANYIEIFFFQSYKLIEKINFINCLLRYTLIRIYNNNEMRWRSIIGKF